MARALGTPAQVGPRVVQKAFYGGLLGCGIATLWWGFSVVSIGLGIVVGACVGAVVGVAIVVFFAFADVMVSRK